MSVCDIGKNVHFMFCDLIHLCHVTMCISVKFKVSFYIQVKHVAFIKDEINLAFAQNKGRGRDICLENYWDRQKNQLATWVL
jgi:hypothetical protein